MCDAKIRPFNDDVHVICRERDKLDANGHWVLHTTHKGILQDYHYDQQSEVVFVWFDDDRRMFRGDFIPCDESKCVFPAGHRGYHVYDDGEYSFEKHF